MNTVIIISAIIILILVFAWVIQRDLKRWSQQECKKLKLENYLLNHKLKELGKHYVAPYDTEELEEMVKRIKSGVNMDYYNTKPLNTIQDETV